MCMLDGGGGFKGGKGRGGDSGFKNGAAGLQHGTGEEGSLHPCAKGHYPK